MERGQLGITGQADIRIVHSDDGHILRNAKSFFLNGPNGTHRDGIIAGKKCRGQPAPGLQHGFHALVGILDGNIHVPHVCFGFQPKLLHCRFVTVPTEVGVGKFPFAGQMGNPVVAVFIQLFCGLITGLKIIHHHRMEGLVPAQIIQHHQRRLTLGKVLQLLAAHFRSKQNDSGTAFLTVLGD